MEQNYDFRARRWQVHRPGLRDPNRQPKSGEVLLEESWALGCSANAPSILLRALVDFQEYLLVSMGVSVRIVQQDGPRVLWMDVDASLGKGMVLQAQAEHIAVTLAAPDFAFRAIVHLEDLMSLELSPVLPLGRLVRRPLYDQRCVHSGCGFDEFPDAELKATVHAGYDAIVLFVKGIDQSGVSYCNINDVIHRAAAFGLKTMLYNYMPSFFHPDEPDAAKKFDSVYGELFRHYPEAYGIMLFGESLEFPSKDPHVSGKCVSENTVDGIPETRPSTGWYPCSDYPAYLSCIAKAVHAVSPQAKVIFGTYNWGYQPLELRKKFLQTMPKEIMLNVTYEIFSQRTLEGLQTPMMDYSISAQEPGYYFKSECAEAHRLGLHIQANANTAGVCWDFGCVPYVPVPYRWLTRCRRLREAHDQWGVTEHYATHHYGWWNSVAADLGKWTSWEGEEPDYEALLQKIARRDYGAAAAPKVLSAWRFWSDAMDHYVASNEDQYGPWRVGPSYPFIFEPNITRTMRPKEIQFPCAKQARFGAHIIKTLYQPYENEFQAPGFLRYPAELRALAQLLAMWQQGLETISPLKDTSPEAARLEALGHFIRNQIRTTMHIKRWWLLNMHLQIADSAEQGLKLLDELTALAHDEIANAEDTRPAVQTDSRIGWEPSMEYVCDVWHLDWKVRQVHSALQEIETYRSILHL